ncbi:helix-turn-helix transcriptional regulator [Cellulomonas sp. zg-ZUI222]|uniref:Helix-turn-helix transcriptional regulator n=1 Tax=Cellulomonas wangleii TaxID=2816956 RepID=A0ABX8D8E4_9CELL|nr:helix-turn-helix transcriptional regulator [Cellulomonas wangleii]MBO0921357.1 helix-turn-helix transcriptional regulator [Cellulomonas wangleii]MBO0925773.1 helix-turn-helix transcriptional regulator [Cellulomonas wangleii]QVI63705.1 helix-turn-helix transcriptional regulator [Cellulomonas wangleii]
MPVAVDSYRRFAVPSALAGVAEHAWVARHAAGRAHAEVLLPDGRGLLQIVRGTGGAVVEPLTGQRTPDRDGVRGAWTHAVVGEQTGPVARLGVQLHPAGLARLRDERPTADTWLPPTAVLDEATVAAAGEQLAAGEDDAAVTTVLGALAARPRRSSADLDHLDDALAFVDERRGLVRATDVAREVGTSLGELHRWCTHLLGTSPAQYLSAVRFSTFVREAVGAGPVDAAATVAAIEWYVAAGYQPREVERFTGLPPVELRRLAEHLAQRFGPGALAR